MVIPQVLTIVASPDDFFDVRGIRLDNICIIASHEICYLCMPIPFEYASTVESSMTQSLNEVRYNASRSQANIQRYLLGCKAMKKMRSLAPFFEAKAKDESIESTVI
jgi:hypothetical protein